MNASMRSSAILISFHEEKMNKALVTKWLPMLLGTLGLTLGFSLAAGARSFQDPEAPQTETQTYLGDPIIRLNLTADQRQRIRAINEENRDQRQRINRQLREAQFALEQTLDGDSPSEDAVEQRIRDVANAHAAQIRMRAMQELKIRRVLTPDQVRIWRDLRARNQNVRRRLNNPEDGRREPRPNLRNQRNGMAPLFPRERRRPRP
jgi:Spy/CpxP family protein refolding chaperone